MQCVDAEKFFDSCSPKKINWGCFIVLMEENGYEISELFLFRNKENSCGYLTYIIE